MVEIVFLVPSYDMGRNRVYDTWRKAGLSHDVHTIT